MPTIAVIFKVLTSQDTLCSLCSMKQGPYFCRFPLQFEIPKIALTLAFHSKYLISSRPRDLSCFNYFCHGCWEQQHVGRTQHKPLMRNIRFLFISGIALFASATHIAVFPCYCLRYFRCRLFHCCSFSSSSSNFRGLTRARAGPTSLPPDFGE